MASARLTFLLKSENMLPRANGIILSDATPLCAFSPVSHTSMLLKLNSLAQCILLRQDYFVFSRPEFCLWFAKRVSAVGLLHLFLNFFGGGGRFVAWKDVDRGLIRVVEIEVDRYVKHLRILFMKSENWFYFGFFWSVACVYFLMDCHQQKGEQLAGRGGFSSQLIGGCSKYMKVRGWTALKTLPQMQSAAVDLLGEVCLQNNRKAFQKGRCKTGFAFQREVDPASLSCFLNWLRRQVPWHKRVML